MARDCGPGGSMTTGTILFEPHCTLQELLVLFYTKT
jgi:hypothetical protein